VGGAQPGAGLFGQLAGRGLRQVLLGPRAVRAGPRPDEPAGQRPAAQVRLLAAPDEQHLELGVPDGQRHHVHGDRDGVVGPRVVAGQEPLRLVHLRQSFSN
jgi:hypothetical protein